MIDNTASAILDTPEWRAAAGLAQRSSSSLPGPQAEQLHRSWLRAASKHLRVSEVMHGMAEVNKNDSADLNLPFHPLHCAASQGMITAGKLVLQKLTGSRSKQGAGINSPDAALGWTPLHWASVTSRLDFMLMLLEVGACIDPRDNAGRTPLYTCAAFGAVDAAVLLLQRGAGVNGPDLRGLTPLHAAASGNHLDVVEELLAAGACVHQRSSVGCTPRHVAERHGHAAMVELLADVARAESEGLASTDTEDAIATVGGGDPLYWLFSQLRATIAGRSPGAQSAA